MRGNVRAFKSDLGETVLRDLHRGAGLPHLLAQDLHLGDGEAGIVSDDDDVGGLEDLLQRRHLLCFCRSIHKLSPVGGSVLGHEGRRLRPAVPASRNAEAGTTLSCPASCAAACATEGPTVRTDHGPVARTAIGLTRLCRRSIKPEAHRWISGTCSLGQDAASRDCQRPFPLPFRCPGGCPKGMGSLIAGRFGEARKGAPTSEAGTPMALYLERFGRLCQARFAAAAHRFAVPPPARYSRPHNT